jgi:hypothetical protein
MLAKSVPTIPPGASYEPKWDGFLRIEKPLIAWVVEYSDPREPGAAFQAGAFTTEAQAQRLVDQLEPAEWRADLRLNMIPVHETVEDWEWDR